MKAIFSILGFIFILITFVTLFFDPYKEVVDSYQVCDTCIKENVEYTCNCKVFNEYTSSLDSWWWVTWGVGLGLLIISIFIKDEE